MTNCPNCGAVVETDKCAYCGTFIYDFGCIDADQPFYLKIKKDEKIYIVHARLVSTEFSITDNDVSYYVDRPFLIHRNPDVEVHMTFLMVDGKIPWEVRQ